MGREESTMDRLLRYQRERYATTSDANMMCADCYCAEPDEGWVEQAPDFRLCADCSAVRAMNDDDEFLSETNVCGHCVDGCLVCSDIAYDRQGS